MEQFAKPSVGSVVTITTKHHEIALESKSKWRENKYSDVEVLPPERWFGPNCIKIAGDVKMPFRVINMSNVSNLKEGDKDIKPSTVSGEDSVVAIKGSSGSVYMVTLMNGNAISCTCPHNVYRKAICKHMKQAVSITC